MKLKLTAFFFGLAVCSHFVCAQESPGGLQVGQEAFNFTGVDQFGESFELNKTLKQGPVVLIFYRGSWCPYCNKHLSQLEDSLNFIQNKGGIVVAVTPEKPKGIDKMIESTSASFKIIHDKDLKIMNTYNVTYRLEDTMVKKYKKGGIDLYASNGDNGPHLPVPATYIIGQGKKVLFAFFDPDYKKRATVGKILQNL